MQFSPSSTNYEHCALSFLDYTLLGSDFSLVQSTLGSALIERSAALVSALVR